MKLTEAQKVFVVVHLATFHTPSETVAAVRERFGFELSREQVYHYDPTRPNGPEKWLELFNEARKKFLKEVSDIPIANQAVRLRRLEQVFQSATRMGRFGNLPLAMQALQQAAEEVGGKFTNHQVLDLDATVGVSGVLRVGEEVSAAEWAGIARQQQEQLAESAEAATKAALPLIRNQKVKGS